MTNRYRGGADFEREVRAHLTREGYDVIRSAGSKTKVDLIAIKTGELLVIQCKRSGTCPPAERVDLLRVARMLPETAVALVASRPRVTFRELTGPGPREWREWRADAPSAGGEGAFIGYAGGTNEKRPPAGASTPGLGGPSPSSDLTREEMRSW